MTRWRSVLIVLVVLGMAGPVFAMRSKRPATLTDLEDTNQLTELNTALSNAWEITNGRYTLENLSSDPNGSRKGQKGDLVYATFPEGEVTSEHVCVNTSYPPATAWTCIDVNPEPVIPEVEVLPTTGIFCPGALSTAENCEEFRGRIPVGCTVQRVDATVTTAPISAPTTTGLVVTGIVIDVNECDKAITGCTSLWSSDPSRRLGILAYETTGQQVVFDDNQIARGHYVSFDIDQVGVTTAGSNLTVTLVCE